LRDINIKIADKNALIKIFIILVVWNYKFIIKNNTEGK
jgi:hypothetical protein